MASIYPKPRRMMMSDDGDGGLRIGVTTSAGAYEIYPLSEIEAASMLRQLAEFVGSKFRARDEAAADAAMARLRRQAGGSD